MKPENTYSLKLWVQDANPFNIPHVIQHSLDQHNNLTVIYWGTKDGQDVYFTITYHQSHWKGMETSRPAPLQVAYSDKHPNAR